LERLTRQAQRTDVDLPVPADLKALILPHAGFAYSGWTAAHASRVLKPGQFQRVVLMGPDHRIGFENGAISDAIAYQTPLGLVHLDPAAHQLRRSSILFKSVPASDRSEHSLEAVLPFLQFYLVDFSLVPIVLGHTAIPAVSDALDPLIDRDTLIVVSSDLSHFLPYDQATARDRETIRMIMGFETERLMARGNRACGLTPILVLLNLARRHGWQPVLLHYANSGDTAGGKNRVVGYVAIAFFEGVSMSDKTVTDATAPHYFSQQQGDMLIRLARQTICDKLGIVRPDLQADIPADTFDDPGYQKRCGTFVTLKKNGRLRGCIGSLSADKSVFEGIRQNAVHAAFRDPRFPPLAAREFPELQIEVSILTEPKPLKYENADDLVNKLRVNVDGVIIRKGSAGATFLPQVWEQLPRTEDFLSHLCLKAGLSADTWRKSHLEVLTYQVQYFEEKH
jgi:AmmeMemoRadiSam system protein B/AmmeMemoRadiSam system protein A